MITRTNTFFLQTSELISQASHVATIVILQQGLCAILTSSAIPISGYACNPPSKQKIEAL